MGLNPIHRLSSALATNFPSWYGRDDASPDRPIDELVRDSLWWDNSVQIPRHSAKSRPRDRKRFCRTRRKRAGHRVSAIHENGHDRAEYLIDHPCAVGANSSCLHVRTAFSRRQSDWMTIVRSGKSLFTK